MEYLAVGVIASSDAPSREIHSSGSNSSSVTSQILLHIIAERELCPVRDPEGPLAQWRIDYRIGQDRWARP